MNWSDFVVIGIIAAFAIIGLIRGFIMSVYKVLSFFAGIYVSIKLYPVLAGVLEKTSIYGSIKDTIVKNLVQWGEKTLDSSATAVSGAAGAETFLGSLPLPEFFRTSILEKLPSPSKLVDMQAIANAAGDEITKAIISIISLLVLIIAVGIALAVVGILVKGISKLPVFKQIDKLGGLIFGALQGFLAVYVVCALLVLFNTNPKFSDVFNSLSTSLFAGWFYNNNFIINRMFR